MGSWFFTYWLYFKHFNEIKTRKVRGRFLSGGGLITGCFNRSCLQEDGFLTGGTYKRQFTAGNFS